MEWPESFSKTGQSVREAAYKEFDVEAITKLSLLPGQEKKGYHGIVLTTDYYLFLFRSRKDPMKFGYFTCGLYAGKQWLELSGQCPENIASYNLLSGGASEREGSVHPSVVGKPAIQQVNINPQMKRLIRVLQTFMALTDDTKRMIKGEPKTLVVLNKLIKEKNSAPTRSNIRSVNTIIYKTLKSGGFKKGRTYTQLVENYEASTGNKLKHIVVDDFNTEIESSRDASTNYHYQPAASF